MNEKRQILAGLLTGSLLLGINVVALANQSENETLPAYTLDETVVTATKNDEKLLSVPASVDVITAKDIKEHNYQTVSEAIQSLPGVFFSPKSESGMGDNIQIRGFGGKDILVLLDGMPMNDTYNNAISWDTLPMNNISKIEVVKGANSSLYGGRAVGAVVQIFTKENELAPGEVSTEITSKYGTNHTWNNKINVNAQLTKKLGVGIGYEKRSSDGYRSYFVKGSGPKANKGGKTYPDYTDKLPRSASGSYLVGTRGDKGHDIKNISANIHYAMTDHQKLQYKYWHTDYRYFYRNPESFIRDDNGKEIFSGTVTVGPNQIVSFRTPSFLGYEGFKESDTHLLNYVDTKNNWKVNLGIYKEKNNGFTSAGNTTDINYTGPGDVSDHPGRTFNFDINKTWNKLGGKHDILVGASYKEEKMTQVRQYLKHWRDKDSTDSSLPNQGISAIYGGKSKNTAFYLQDEYAVSKPTTLYLGVRYDKFTKADGYTKNYDEANNYQLIDSLTYGNTSYTQVSPKLAVDYKADENTHFYASFGHSFNPPPLYQIYRDGGGGMGEVIANPELKPERSDNIELGMKKQLNKATFLSLALFKVDTKDKIYYKRFYDKNNPKQIAYKQYVNGDKEKRRGVEFALKHKFDKRWNGYFNYTYQQGKMYNNGQEVRDYNIPRHILHTGMEYKVDKYRTLLDFEYASARQSKYDTTGRYGSADSFWLVNTTFNYQINEDASLQFAVYNLFNRKIYDDEATSKRAFTLGLNYNF